MIGISSKREQILTGALALGLALSFWVSPVRAADIACRAEVNRTTVPQGGTLSLTVTAEGGITWSADFALPEISGVQFFGGGTNQSVSYANGQTMTIVAKSYYLQVDTEEDFVIGPIVVTSDGKTCQTEPISIKVGPPADDAANPPPDQTGNRTRAPTSIPSDPAQSLDGSGDDIFITLEADRNEVWVGQQLVLSFKYYRRIQPWNNPQFTAPRTEGFWREELGQERRYRAVVKGRSYTVTEIRYALFPTRTGELTIEPAELAFPDQGLERFFSSRRRSGPRVLRTDPVTVTVKALPSGQPDNFSGLVATQAELKSVVDRPEVPRGEPVSWTTQLVSDGFLKGFAGIELPEPEGARSHDAGEGFVTRAEEGRLMGSVTREKVIVPSEEGVLRIPAVELSWFDAAAGRYRIARTSPRQVSVIPSDLPYLPDEDSGFLRNEVARLAQDLAFIHNVPSHLGSGSWSPLTSPLWWTGLILPLLLLGGWWLYLQRLSALNRDPAARRRRGALTAAIQLLEQISSASDDAGALALLTRAVAGFVADCRNQPLAAVGPAEVEAYVRAQGQPESAQRLREIMDLSESARFGGLGNPQGTGSLDPRALARETRELLENLARAKHPGGVSGGAGVALAVVLLVGACLPLAAQAEVDPARLMAEANQAYTAGDLDLTLQLYTQVEEMGVQDPTLYFNLGNTFARRGELGRAVTYYLRAQRLDPRDPDISANLDWVRGHITDLELSDAPLPLFVAQFVWLARYLTVAEWSLLVLLLVWLVVGLVAWGWYQGRFSDSLRRTALVAGAVLAITVVVFAWRWHGQEIARQAVVVAPEVSVLSGPDNSFPVLFKVHDGLTVLVEGRQQGWVRISLGGESLGWLPEAAVLPVNPRQES